MVGLSSGGSNSQQRTSNGLVLLGCSRRRLLVGGRFVGGNVPVIIRRGFEGQQRQFMSGRATVAEDPGDEPGVWQGNCNLNETGRRPLPAHGSVDYGHE